jgi:hypothetical protein
MRARWTVSATLLALAALVAMPAMAEESETDSADRALIHSYDPDAMQLLWATSGVDEDAEDYCNVQDGYEYTYEVDGEDVTVTLDDEELAEACDFTATDVTGPEGQVNHGTVVSAFVQALKANGYTGIGCYVRLIAQSDYGMGDQQVNVGDSEGEGDATEPDATEPEPLSFSVDYTQCGKPDHAGPPEDAGRPDDAGPPEGVGKPDWAGQGKPDDAGPPEDAGRPDDAGPPTDKGGRP